MFPLVLDLRKKLALVVGAGRVGCRKTEALVAAGAHVRVVDPDPAAGPPASPGVRRIVEAYTAEHLNGVALAFACASQSVNSTVVADARRHGVWVCDAADPSRGDFAVPAVHRQGELNIAVSTGGAAPGLAKRIAGRLATEYDAAYADWVRVLGEVRVVVRGAVPDPAIRRQLLERFVEPAWLDRLRAVGPDVVRAEMLACVRSN
jgi:siroheme synthase-like protein